MRAPRNPPPPLLLLGAPCMFVCLSWLLTFEQRAHPAKERRSGRGSWKEGLGVTIADATNSPPPKRMSSFRARLRCLLVLLLPFLLGYGTSCQRPLGARRRRPGGPTSCRLSLPTSRISSASHPHLIRIAAGHRG
ncbi:hypothetical protein EV126DRAFT_413457 [Verticillium dahliae]|nr:hypothetical protein EV126DRAFT_413457 [Verticillium dahliae]